MTVQFEPNTPVYTVTFTRVIPRQPETRYYGGLYSSYSTYTPSPERSYQTVGPFDSKELAEQALLSVLSSDNSRDVRINEWASLVVYNDHKHKMLQSEIEMSKRMAESWLRVAEEHKSEPEPESAPKKKGWFR